MKKRILAMLLALCLALSLGTMAFAAEGKETAEVNEYGLTDAATQALVTKIRAHLREDYLSVYNIAAADFSWPEAESDVWRSIVAVPNMAYSAGMSLTDAPEEQGNTFEDESLNTLAGAVAAGLREWVAADEEGDDNFTALWGSLSDGRTFSQFVTEYVTFRPAKTAEDEVTEEDLQEILAYIGKAVEDEFLTPNGIDPAVLVWPTDPGAFRYFDEMVTNYCISTLTGLAPDPVREEYVPASPDKEIMDAVYAGAINWLDEFESVDYDYMIAWSQKISNFDYIMEYLPANLAFE